MFQGDDEEADERRRRSLERERQHESFTAPATSEEGKEGEEVRYAKVSLSSNPLPLQGHKWTSSDPSVCQHEKYDPTPRHRRLRP